MNFNGRPMMYTTMKQMKRKFIFILFSIFPEITYPQYSPPRS